MASGLAPGFYRLGLCGFSDDAADWTNNDFVEQTALIFDQGTIIQAASHANAETIRN